MLAVAIAAAGFGNPREVATASDLAETDRRA
jgi:hypothetical protein